MGLDHAIEYVNLIERFRATLQSQEKGCQITGDTVEIESGRKYDKVYIRTPHQRLGRYMVDRHTWIIYAIKSWAQVNLRRQFGTLDTIDQYDWTGFHGVPRAGTSAEVAHVKREVAIEKAYRQRGRPKGKIK